MQVFADHIIERIAIDQVPRFAEGGHASTGALCGLGDLGDALILLQRWAA